MLWGYIGYILQVFSQEEASTSVHMLQVQAGQPAAKRRKKYDNIDSRLHQLGLDYMICHRTMEAVGHMMDNTGLK